MFRLVGMGMFAATIFFGVIIGFVQEDTNGLQVSLEKISGQVVDVNGDAIERFSATLQINSPDSRRELNADLQDGQFQFEPDVPVAVNRETWVRLTIESDGYFQTRQIINMPLRQSRWSENLGKITLLKAVDLKGKLELKNQQQAKLDTPRLQFRESRSGLVSNKFPFAKSIFGGDDGRFQVKVPENTLIDIFASSRNGTPTVKRIKVAKQSEQSVQDIGTIKLGEGVSVSGTVLTKDGQPAVGQLVKISGREKTGSLFDDREITSHAVTDAQGKFTLPPRLGKCTISLAKTGKQGFEISPNKKVVVEKALPIKPVVVQLKKGKTIEPITLREVPTCKVAGRIVGLDQDSEVSVWVAVNQQAADVTLEGGKFEFTVPEGVESILFISSIVENKLNFASLTVDSREMYGQYLENPNQRQTQAFKIKALDADLGPIEFELEEYYGPAAITFTEMFWEWLFGIE